MQNFGKFSDLILTLNLAKGATLKVKPKSTTNNKYDSQCDQ